MICCAREARQGFEGDSTQCLCPDLADIVIAGHGKGWEDLAEDAPPQLGALLRCLSWQIAAPGPAVASTIGGPIRFAGFEGNP